MRTIFVDASVEWSNPSCPSKGIPLRVKIAAYCQETREAIVREVEPHFQKQDEAVEAAEMDAIQLAIREMNPDLICTDSSNASSWNVGVPLKLVSRQENKVADWLSKGSTGHGVVIFRADKPERGWIKFNIEA